MVHMMRMAPAQLGPVLSVLQLIIILISCSNLYIEIERFNFTWVLYAICIGTWDWTRMCVLVHIPILGADIFIPKWENWIFDIVSLYFSYF